MNELLWRHENFVKKLEEDYRLAGYEILDSLPNQHELGGYVPDMVVCKDGVTTIIEVKTTDRAAQHPLIHELRKKVESQGYRFALKVVPRTPAPRPLEERPERVAELLVKARMLIDQGDADLAILASWIAIEICVRNFVHQRGTDMDHPPQSREIIGMAADWDLIEEKQIPDLQVFLDMRSRIAHGYFSGTSTSMAQKAIGYAQDIACKSGLVPETVSPS